MCLCNALSTTAGKLERMFGALESSIVKLDGKRGSY